MGNQRKDQNKTLKSGERQVKNKLAEIDSTHVQRYERAKKYIGDKEIVVDVGMGCGYGSFMLGEVAQVVVGIDDSQEAVDYAKENWSRTNIAYLQGNVFDVLRPHEDACDTIVAFEVLEHIRDDKKLVELFKTVAQKRIIISVPHISVPLSRSKWHWRHYSNEDIMKLFEDSCWYVESIDNIFQEGKGVDVFAVITRAE